MRNPSNRDDGSYLTSYIGGPPTGDHMSVQSFAPPVSRASVQTVGAVPTGPSYRIGDKKEPSVKKLMASFLKRDKKKRPSRAIFLLSLLLLATVGVAALFLTQGGDEEPAQAETTLSPTASTDQTPVTTAPTTFTPITRSPTRPTNEFPTPAPTTFTPITRSPTRPTNEFPTPAPTTRAPTRSPFPEEIRDKEEDTIGVYFDESEAKLDDRTKEAFLKAAQKWNEITRGTVEKYNPKVVVSAEQTFCNAIKFPKDEAGDHLRLFLKGLKGDGTGGFTASSGPCAFSNFPVVSFIDIDIKDAIDLDKKGVLDIVLFKQIGFSLGFGVLWKKTSIEAGINQAGTALVQKTIFDVDGKQIADPKQSQPIFIGTQAIKEYNQIVNADAVPVENGIDSAGNPLFEPLSSGLGIIDAAWDSDFLPGELFERRTFVNSALSTVTLGSLQDMGYVIDFEFADKFPLPQKLRAQNSEIKMKTVIRTNPIQLK